jgi:hypothetical protein
LRVRTATNVSKLDDQYQPQAMLEAANHMNEKQSQGCNAQAAGYQKAATSLITNLEWIAAGMCKSTEATPGSEQFGPPKPRLKDKPRTAGCANTPSVGGNPESDFNAANAPEGETISKYSGPGIAVPSIEAKSGQNGKTLNHEISGHSIGGYPNGKCAGYGIGYGKQADKDLCGDQERGDSWDEKACDTFRSQAKRKPQGVAYDKGLPPEEYYTKEPASRRYDLENPKPMFEQRTELAKAAQGKTGGGRAGNAPNATFSYDSAKTRGPAVAEAPPNPNPPTDGHKKGVQAAGLALAGGPVGASAPVVSVGRKDRPGGGGPGDTAKIEYQSGGGPDATANPDFSGAAGSPGGKGGKGETTAITYESGSGRAPGSFRDTASSDFWKGKGKGGGTGSGSGAGTGGSRSPASDAEGLALATDRRGSALVGGGSSGGSSDSNFSNAVFNVGAPAKAEPSERGRRRPDTGAVRTDNTYQVQ